MSSTNSTQRWVLIERAEPLAYFENEDDAAKLVDMLKKAVTALREANVMADEVKAYGDGEHNEFGRVFTAMHNYRAALRRMTGGE